MRLDIRPILDAARSLLAAVEAKDDIVASARAATLLGVVPDRNPFETAPGAAIYYGAERAVAGLLPVVRHSAASWHRWFLSPRPDDAAWPEPTVLASCVAALEDVARQCGIEAVPGEAGSAVSPRS